MPSSPRRFAQVDVFTECPGLGNPVAVVLDADRVPDERMQRLATWTNLSETTFVLPPTDPAADYRVRIFTPGRELPFAGHPTIGTCKSLLDARELTSSASWVQECGAGLVEIRRLADGALAFAAPAPVAVVPFAATDEKALLARALGGAPVRDPAVVEIGPRWLTALTTLDALNAARPDPAVFAELPTPDVTVYAQDDSGDLHVRSFFLENGQVTEDPVCGSGNACVARHTRIAGLETGSGYRAFQGRHRGRDGRITVELGERDWIGGPAVTVVSGTIRI